MTIAVLADRAGMASTTSGTGTLTLGAALGAVVTNTCSYQSFATAGVATGESVSYLILDANGNWEVGRGTYTSAGTTLTRGPLYSSNSGAAINLSGSEQVFIAALAEDLSSYSQAGGLINKFRNATMDVWQRGTASTSVSTSGAYFADGWIVLPTGAAVTASQQTNNRTGALTNFCLRVTGAASVSDITIKQRIEGAIAAPLASFNVTVQVWALQSSGGSITPTLTVKVPTATDNYSSTTTTVSAVALQACPDVTWTLLSYTFAAASNSGLGMEVAIDFGNNFASGAKYCQITECDIRATPSYPAVGQTSNPPPAELRPIQHEMIFCERYFETTYDNGTAAGAATRIGMALLAVGSPGPTVNVGVGLPFRVVKRATSPTMAYYDGAGTSGKASFYSGSYGDALATVSAIDSGMKAWHASLSTGVQLNCLVHYTASAEI